ncbi:hypothetical protein [Streptomyces sp. NRRL S-37]|uniref:hypothetical protein n=1 Tax=Streptomyces sp. NRRL S-37 TaxID=1463903 RepID=UPI0004CB8BBD|nr:hypothetical protein [Streptomyces sp. NRRL S-37]
MTSAERIRKAAELAQTAESRFGQDQITHTTGEGLAAIANALMALAGPPASPTVWLEVGTGTTSSWIRSDDIVGARVRQTAGDEEQFLLEMFVRGLATPDEWLLVAQGSTEWFELNAAEELLTALESSPRTGR